MKKRLASALLAVALVVTAVGATVHVAQQPATLLAHPGGNGGTGTGRG
jgi:hypothetical protein